jgi:hypothetical protein
MNEPNSPDQPPFRPEQLEPRGIQPASNPFADDAEIIEAEAINEWTGSPPKGWKPPPFDPRQPQPDVTYHVPKRFGMSAILGITTALALLFGLLRWLSAPEAMYLFFGTQAMVICVAQMRYGDVPRQASVIAGAIMLPMFLIGYAMFVPMPRMGEEFACLVVGSLPLGAFLGYATGTFAGSVFLLMDLFEQYWTARNTAHSPTPVPPAKSPKQT